MRKSYWLVVIVSAGLIAYLLLGKGKTAVDKVAPLPIESLAVHTPPPQRESVSPHSHDKSEPVIKKTADQKPKTNWEPTAEQKTSLEKAKQSEQDWDKQRATFLEVDLKLSESDVAQLAKLRRDTTAAENSLLSEISDNEEDEEVRAKALKNNRSQYETQIQKLLGPSRYVSYLTFYKAQWKSDGTGMHLPLK